VRGEEEKDGSETERDEERERGMAEETLRLE